jgi:hypothetical protein
MLSDDEVIRAVRWALGVQAYGSDGDLWQDFLKRTSSVEERRRIAKALGDMVERAVLLKMGIVEGGIEQFEKQLVEKFFETAGKSLAVRTQLIQKLKAILYPSRTPAAAAPAPKPAPKPATLLKLDGHASFPARPAAAPPPPPREAEPVKPQVKSAPAAPPPPAPESPRPVETAPPAEPPVEAAPVALLAAPEARPADEMLPGIALWKYVEVPDPADLHTDSDAHPFTPVTDRFQFIGARVRGRKHKHEATNCDDWFEAGTAGRWEIVAVSDGAGSCKLSRIGAKVSTQTAVEFLRRELASAKLGLEGDAPEEVLERNEQGAFLRDDLQRVQELLHEAVRLAHQAVAEEAARREVDAKLLSSTLRLAVHSSLDRGRRPADFILACGVGDGMSAAIDAAGRLHLLAAEESGGKYSGETEFLTDQRTIEPDRLAASTYPFLGPLRALLVMSDGVADPYFPNDPGMLRLFGDLIVNGVLTVPGVDEEAIGRVERDLSKFSYAVDTPISPTERLRARIRQSDRLAELIGISLEEILKWPPLLLLGGARGEPLAESFGGAPAAERLRMWLDAFYVRGEFDDRALVVLYREAGL